MAKLKELAAYYQRRYATPPGPLRDYARYLDLADVCGGERLLDVGCGEGFLLAEAHARGLSATGTDLVRAALGWARERAGPVVLAAGEALPFADESFDIVTCLGSLEHFADPPQGARELARVTRRNGRLLIVVPNRRFAGWLPLSLWRGGRGTEQREVAEMLLDRREWKVLLEGAGIDVVETVKEPWHTKPYRSRWARLALRFAWWAIPLRWTYQFAFLGRPAAAPAKGSERASDRRSHEVRPPDSGDSAAEKALVILPTYNERDNLMAIVGGILEQDPRLDVLIVDDSSPDGTGDLARQLAAQSPRVHVLERPAKMGLGTAYLTGFEWALERSYDFVFEMDADLSHDPRHLPEFLAAIRDHDLVLGSRYLRGVTVVNWPLSRLLLSMSANLYARVVTGVPFTDLTGGFKCFRRRVLEELDLISVRSEGYSFQIEITSRAWARGFRIAEIPIVFVDRTKGESKLNRGIIWEAVWMVWKIRLWRILGRL